MKRCPTCNKTYSDDSMSFCLEDGAPLLSVGAEAPPASGSFDPNLTIPFTPPRETSDPSSRGAQGSGWGAPTGGPTSGGGQPGPPSGFGQQPGGGGQYGQSSGGQYGQQGGQYGGPQSGQFPPPPPQSGQYQPTPSWTPPQQSFAAPQKKSALPWILGGIAALIVLGVVGAVIIGVLASMGSKANKNNSNNSNSSNRSNRNSTTTNTTNSNNSNSTNTSTASSGTPVASDDFSSQNWWVGTVNVGTAMYQNGEYHLHSNSSGYMVVYGPESFRSENATTRVTVRSVSGSSPTDGYGLAVFGEMTKKNELEDYCFLIRSGDTPAYRVVMHRGGKETVLIDWTEASQIRIGTSPNQLEVRASGTRASFYINGQYAGAVDATKGYDFGLAGFYTSGTEEVAFDDLQITK